VFCLRELEEHFPGRIYASRIKMAPRKSKATTTSPAKKDMATTAVTPSPDIASSDAAPQSAGVLEETLTDSAVTSQPISITTQASLLDMSEDVPDDLFNLPSAMPPPPSFPCDPNLMMAGFFNYLNHCSNLPMMNMFSSRGGLKTGSARGMPATTLRGEDAVEALSCGDGSDLGQRVHEQALPFDTYPTDRTSVDFAQFESTSGHAGDRGRIVAAQDTRQRSHVGSVEECLITGGQSQVGGSGGALRGLTPVRADQSGDDMRSLGTGSQRSDRHSRSPLIQRSLSNQRSQVGPDSHKRGDKDQRSNRGHKSPVTGHRSAVTGHQSPASDSRWSSDPTGRGRVETTAGGQASGQAVSGQAVGGQSADRGPGYSAQGSQTRGPTQDSAVNNSQEGYDRQNHQPNARVRSPSKVVRTFTGDRPSVDQRASTSRVYSPSSGQRQAASGRRSESHNAPQRLGQSSYGSAQRSERADQSRAVTNQRSRSGGQGTSTGQVTSGGQGTSSGQTFPSSQKAQRSRGRSVQRTPSPQRSLTPQRSLDPAEFSDQSDGGRHSRDGRSRSRSSVRRSRSRSFSRRRSRSRSPSGSDFDQRDGKYSSRKVSQDRSRRRDRFVEIPLAPSRTLRTIRDSTARVSGGRRRHADSSRVPAAPSKRARRNYSDDDTSRRDPYESPRRSSSRRSRSRSRSPRAAESEYVPLGSYREMLEVMETFLGDDLPSCSLPSKPRQFRSAIRAPLATLDPLRPLPISPLITTAILDAQKSFFNFDTQDVCSRPPLHIPPPLKAKKPSLPIFKESFYSTPDSILSPKACALESDAATLWGSKDSTVKKFSLDDKTVDNIESAARRSLLAINHSEWFLMALRRADEVILDDQATQEEYDDALWLNARLKESIGMCLETIARHNTFTLSTLVSTKRDAVLGLHRDILHPGVQPFLRAQPLLNKTALFGPVAETARPLQESSRADKTLRAVVAMGKSASARSTSRTYSSNPSKAPRRDSSKGKAPMYPPRSSSSSYRSSTARPKSTSSANYRKPKEDFTAPPPATRGSSSRGAPFRGRGARRPYRK
jgi:hypothetical protein